MAVIDSYLHFSRPVQFVGDELHVITGLTTSKDSTTGRVTINANMHDIVLFKYPGGFFSREITKEVASSLLRQVRKLGVETEIKIRRSA